MTLLTIPIVDPFWTMPGPQATQASLESEEDLTVIGGLIAVSLLNRMKCERKGQRLNAP